MRFPIQDIKSRQQLSLLLPPHGIGVEFGVDEGDHAQTLINFSNAKKIYLVDFWSYNASREGFENWKDKLDRVRARFAVQVAAGLVEIVDSTFRDFLDKFPDEYFDWGYLDGWHSYKDVTRDAGDILPKLKRGAIFGGHDFKVEPKDWGTGCCRAVLELVQNGVGPLIGLSNEENSDWVIRKGGFNL